MNLETRDKILLALIIDFWVKRQFKDGDRAKLQRISEVLGRVTGVSHFEYQRFIKALVRGSVTGSFPNIQRRVQLAQLVMGRIIWEEKKLPDKLFFECIDKWAISRNIPPQEFGRF